MRTFILTFLFLLLSLHVSEAGAVDAASSDGILAYLVDSSQDVGKKDDELMPYIQEEVVFSNKGVTLAGTLKKFGIKTFYLFWIMWMFFFPMNRKPCVFLGVRRLRKL